MKYSAAFFILFLAANFALAQKSEYDISIKNQRLVVRHQGKAHALAFAADRIDAAKITNAKILFANRRENGFVYLVVDVTGQSREKQNDRQCGAGIESNLIWIKLGANWQITDSQSHRYESCWSGVTSEEGYKINGKTLTIEFDNFRAGKTNFLSYNADEPEKGFQLAEKSFETGK